MKYYIMPPNALGSRQVIDGGSVPTDMTGVTVVDLVPGSIYCAPAGKIVIKNDSYQIYNNREIATHKIALAIAAGQITKEV